MSSHEHVRVLIVDDHPVVRSGLRAISALDPRLEVVAEAGSIADAVRTLSNAQPDVILLDLRLPDGTGTEVSRQAKRLLPRVRVLCLSSFDDPALVLAALAAGAEAYLLKHSDVAKIVDAIHRVLAGEQVIDSGLTPAPASAAESAESAPALSPAEARVMDQVARGLTDKEVASALGLSAKTVRHALDRAFRKLGVRSRTQAVLVHLRQR